MDFSNAHVALNNSFLEASAEEHSQPHQDEELYFEHYDQAMEAARMSADLQDYYYGWQRNEQPEVPQQWYYHSDGQAADDAMDYEHEDEEMEEDQDGYYYYEDDRQSVASDESYNNEALLSLIAGVQSYISEATNAGVVQDSPLMELQYKMYTYMKQQACEMGYNADELYYPS